jgi:cytochrome c
MAQKVARASIWDGVFSKAQAERGEAIYRARCAVCHGQDLIADIEAPSLTGPRFNVDWVGKTIDDQLQRVRRTMPETNPGSLRLDDQANIDIVAYILQFNSYPSGEQELGVDTEILKRIVIEPPKPR